MYENHNTYLQSELDYRRDRIRAASRAAGTRQGRLTRRAGRPRHQRHPSADPRKMSNRVAAREIMGDVAGHASRTLVGRDAELTEIASLLGVRPASGTAGARNGPATTDGGRQRAAVRRRRRRQDPAAHRAARRRAFTEGWQVFAGHCLDFGDSALPYLPFSEVLGRMAADLPDVVDAIAGVHPALARLQPGRRVMSRRRGRRAVRAGPRRPVRGRARAARGRRRAAPLLLVIEDAHWADQSTRDMLSFLFTRPFGGPVAIVASYRSDDLHRRHPLRRQVAEWSRIRGVDRLSCRRCRRPTSARLIAELGGVLDETEVADIVERAEGNAFFVEELVGAAVRSRSLGARRPRRRAAGPARPARRPRPPGRPDRERRRPPGLPRDARRRLRPGPDRARRGPAAGGRDERARRRRGALRVPARAARARRCTTTCCPASGSGCTRRTPTPCARAAPGARRPSWPATPGWPWTSRPPSPPASRPATRPARSAAPTRRRTTSSRRSSCSPTRAGSPATDLDVSRLVVKTAEALVASGHRRAGGRAARRAARPAARRRARRPGSPGCSRSAPPRCRVIETDEDPAAVSAEALALVPDDAPALRAKVLGVHARSLMSWAATRRPSRWGSTRSSWPSGSTSTSWPPTRSPR